MNIRRIVAVLVAAGALLTLLVLAACGQNTDNWCFDGMHYDTRHGEEFYRYVDRKTGEEHLLIHWKSRMRRDVPSCGKYDQQSTITAWSEQREERNRIWNDWDPNMRLSDEEFRLFDWCYAFSDPIGSIYIEDDTGNLYRDRSTEEGVTWVYDHVPDCPDEMRREMLEDHGSTPEEIERVLSHRR